MKLRNPTAALVGLVTLLGLVAALAVSSSPASAASCFVRASDRALFCGNVFNAAVKLTPENDRNGVPVRTVDNLHTTFSYFKCYTVGQRHSGGNNIWYRTVGDVNGRWGYVAAAAVFTPTDPFRNTARC